MKKNIVLLLICMSLFGCNNNQNIYSGKYLIPSENIYTLLDSFAREANCNDCIYEVYIDIQSPDIHHIILYAGNKSLTETIQSYPILKFVNVVKINNIEFNIYSGLEKYFATPRDSLKKSHAANTIEIKKTWVVLDSCDNYIIHKLKNDDVIPFFPFPSFNVDIGISPPDIVSE